MAQTNIPTYSFGTAAVRLFLTTRAIFLLVWAARTPEEAESETNHSLEYWLDQIPESHGVKSTILIQNRVDETNGEIDGKNELTAAQKRKIFRHEIQTVASEKRHIGEVRDRLKELIYEHQKRWNYKVLASWDAVRRELDPTRKRVLLHDEFLKLCRENKVKHPKALLGYLHRGGAVFYREGFLNNALIVDQPRMSSTAG